MRRYCPSCGVKFNDRLKSSDEQYLFYSLKCPRCDFLIPPPSDVQEDYFPSIKSLETIEPKDVQEDNEIPEPVIFESDENEFVLKD